MRHVILAVLVAASGVAYAQAPPDEPQASDRCAEGPRCDGIALGGAFYLVAGKAIAGPWLDISIDRWRVSGSTAFIAAQNSDPSFLDNLFTVHAAARLLELPRAELNAGTGVDVFALWGINLDERKYALPVFAEVRGELSNGFGAAAQARFYLIKSDGLEPGVRRNGERAFPVFLVLSVYKAARP